MAQLHLLLYCATTLLIANALVLTPQLLSAAAAASGADNEQGGIIGKSKTSSYPFPLDDDVEGVELPMEVEAQEDQAQTQRQSQQQQHSMPPPWLEFAEDPVPPKHRISHKPTVIKHPTNGFHKLSSHGHRSCYVEITKHVEGICQSMPLGSACVTDDYMVIYNDGNCSTQ
ncbi:uncharacterized protein LOC117579995 [Drosophila guanche]|uniref:Uncharacterized protein n=1 Tax=Drosophila guanche TaxID=7266 RepID=A0A3B0JS52_DROGU|nr:uncharacterized protein LOC117579995 [Drosophila guanche]SPP76539.1 Hypothetical predicted protein [Drosophila guanche]